MRRESSSSSSPQARNSQSSQKLPTDLVRIGERSKRRQRELVQEEVRIDEGGLWMRRDELYDLGLLEERGKLLKDSNRTRVQSSGS